MIDQIAAPVIDDINQMYEQLKHGPHGQEVQQLLAAYHFESLALLQGVNPWEKAEMLYGLQEKLRDRLKGLLD